MENARGLVSGRTVSRLQSLYGDGEPDQDIPPPGRLSATCRRAMEFLQGETPASLAAPPPLNFPVFAMRMAEFLQLRQLCTWEEARAQGLLIEWCGDDGPLNFVSHQWLDPAHPDPHGEKLLIIQAVFRALSAGAVDQCMAADEWSTYSNTYTDFYAEDGTRLALSKAEFARSVREGCVWLDLFSVPQENVPLQRRAIASLAAYVSYSANVFVVAPPMLGRFGPCDLGTWSGRGWCRVEKWAAELRTHVSGSARRPLLVEAATQVRVSNFSDQMTFGVRQGPLVGRFSVGSDADVIRPVLHAMYARKLAALLRAGDALHFQWFLFCRPHVCAELQHAADGDGRGNGDDAMEALLRRYGFAGPADVLEGHPFTPLFCAAAEGNVAVVRQMVDHGVDVNGWDALGVNTPLHGACSMGSTRCIALLLRAAADPCAKTLHRSIAPLHRAAAIGDADGLALLLDAKADIDCQRKDTGQTAAHLAAEAAEQKHKDCYALLRARGANELLQDGDGITAKAVWEETMRGLTLSALTPSAPRSQQDPRKGSLQRHQRRRSSSGLSWQSDASHFSETARLRWSRSELDKGLEAQRYSYSNGPSEAEEDDAFKYWRMAGPTVQLSASKNGGK